MKVLILAFVFASVLSSMASAYVYYVDSYQKSDGSFVSGHYKTSPDSYKWNNLGD